MSFSLLRTGILTTAMVTAVAPALAQSTVAKADAKSGIIATVNGKPVPKNRADAMLAAMVAQGQADTEQLRNAIREELISRELLSQQAQKENLDKKPDVVTQLDWARTSVLINAYKAEYFRIHPVTDNAVRAEYDTLRAQLGNKEYKARHILVDSEADAKAIIARLNKGERFAALAEQSKDTGSSERGGDLGWAAATSYTEPFAQALIGLQKGKYTAAPVKSQFGYHVILQEDARDLKVPSFDEVKEKLSDRLQKQIFDKHLADLRSNAKLE